MVLRRPPPARAFVVPDEEAWLVFGASATGAAFETTSDVRTADLLVVAEQIPDELVVPLRHVWNGMRPGAEVRTFSMPVTGRDATEILRDARRDDAGDHGPDDRRHGAAHGGDPMEHGAAHGGDEMGHGAAHGGDPMEHGAAPADGGTEHAAAHGGHEMSHGGHHEDGGGHDHGDMMAITGEPSADGLVMEDLEVVAGPLGIGLPGGLVVEATLDGDIVADCKVVATLRQSDPAAPPDPFAALAWNAAELAATERAAGVVVPDALWWLRVAAIEGERAASHLTFLHRFLRLLGWSAMLPRVREPLARLIAGARRLPVELATPDLADVSGEETQTRLRDVARECRRLAADLEGSRRLAQRTTGLGVVGADEALERGLVGPTARASGLERDERLADPLYERIGFETLVRQEGDTRARVLLRALEAGHAVEVANRAIERAANRQPASGGGLLAAGGAVVEGPEGPLRVVRAAAGADVARSATGARQAREAAAAASIGCEWGAALVVVASFGISPWRVGP